MYLIITHTKIFKAASFDEHDARAAAVHGHRVVHLPFVAPDMYVEELEPWLTGYMDHEEIDYRPGDAPSVPTPTHITTDGREKVNY